VKLTTYKFNVMQHILYRQKEQFSDGVGYGWIDGIKDHAAKHVNINPTFSFQFHFTFVARHVANNSFLKFFV